MRRVSFSLDMPRRVQKEEPDTAIAVDMKSSISEGLAKRLAPYEEVKEKILRRRMKDEKKRELLERLAKMKAEAETYYLEYEETRRIRRRR